MQNSSIIAGDSPLVKEKMFSSERKLFFCKGHPGTSQLPPHPADSLPLDGSKFTYWHNKKHHPNGWCFFCGSYDKLIQFVMIQLCITLIQCNRQVTTARRVHNLLRSAQFHPSAENSYNPNQASGNPRASFFPDSR